MLHCQQERTVIVVSIHVFQCAVDIQLLPDYGTPVIIARAVGRIADFGVFYHTPFCVLNHETRRTEI